MTSMKIWLTAKAIVNSMTHTGGPADPQPGEKVKLYGATVETSAVSGGKYVTLHLDAIDPCVDIPRFAGGHVRMITSSDTYHEGFRPEGMYEYAGARAMVKTEVKVDSPYMGNTADVTTVERRQKISISAKSIRSLREIYTRIRQGKLQPTEQWSDGGEEGVTFAETSHNGF